MIELTTSALILLSMFYSGATISASAVKNNPQEADAKQTLSYVSDRSIVDGMALIAPVGNAKTVEGSVREYFKDTPILVEIAKCESRFRHLGKNGEVIRGEINSDDLGVMQINDYFHGENAEKLGLNLSTLSGNMAYAKQLYEKEGTVPWQSSSGCWNKYVSISKI